MSALFSAYKAVGHVCDSIPFVLNRLGEETFLTVSIGKCFQVFRIDKLAVCLVSNSMDENISAIEVWIII
jgi:hypothetical protein